MIDVDKVTENIKKRQDEYDRIWNAAIEAAMSKLEVQAGKLFADIIKDLKR